jgi:uncharacterized protein YndB with AHSA1/START domain
MTTTKITAPEGQPFVDIEREFDAPRELVMRAYTEPDLVKQWLGPRNYEMRIDRWDARAGGEYRYIHTDGKEEYAFHGVFHSYDADSMIQTFEFEGAPGHVSLDTQVLEDLGNGRTRVKGHSVFMSVEDRDAMVEAGMSMGIEEGFDRLDELLPTLRTAVGATS